MRTSIKEIPSITAPLSKKENRKEQKQDSRTFQDVCGKRPLLRKRRLAWEQCVRRAKESGVSSFNGGYVSHENHSDVEGFFNDLIL